MIYNNCLNLKLKPVKNEYIIIYYNQYFLSDSKSVAETYIHLFLDFFQSGRHIQ